MREIIGAQQKKELIPDGNRRKPPISSVQQLPCAAGDNKDSSSVISDRSTGARPLSTVSSDGQTIIMDDIDDIDDDITTTASESYAQDDSSTNEGNILPNEMSSMCVRVSVYFGRCRVWASSEKIFHCSKYCSEIARTLNYSRLYMKILSQQINTSVATS